MKKNQFYAKIFFKVGLRKLNGDLSGFFRFKDEEVEMWHKIFSRLNDEWLSKIYSSKKLLHKIRVCFK